MAETKRVSDQYKISAPAIVIDGNLTVMGSTTSVETINSVIQDNILVLNEGVNTSIIFINYLYKYEKYIYWPRKTIN